MSYPLKLLSAVLVLAIVACGGGDPAEKDDTKSISGVISKGLISGASINLYSFQADGTRGAHVAGPVLSINGIWDVELPPNVNGPFMVVASGGSYVDEASGETVNLDSNDELMSILPAGEDSVAITPLSHLAVIIVQTRIPELSLADAVSQSVASLETAFGFDPLMTMPQNPSAVPDNASVEEKRYTAMLGGLSYLLHEHTALNSAGLDGAHRFELVKALVADLSDGELDGVVGNGVPIVVSDGSGGSRNFPDLGGMGDLDSASQSFITSNPELNGTTLTTIDLGFLLPTDGSGDDAQDNNGNTPSPEDDVVVVNDSDGDGVVDTQDNCPTVANAMQADTDIDNIGDDCDPLITPEPKKEIFTGNDLLAAASGIYSKTTVLDASNDLTQFFKDYGMPILDISVDRSFLQPVIDNGIPFVTKNQITEMAKGFVEGRKVSLKSVVGTSRYPYTTGALRLSHGVIPTVKNASLSAEFLRDQFVSIGVVDKLDNNGNFNNRDLIPGLLAALARTRMQNRGFTMTDPIWGDDDLLDPLQFFLLSYSALYASSGDEFGFENNAPSEKITPRAAIPLSPLIDWAKQKLGKEIVDSVMSDILELPKTPLEAIDAAVCVSAVMYSYHIKMNSDGNQIFGPLRDPTDSDAPLSFDDGPDKLNITANLVFEPLDEQWAAFISEMMNCEIPFGNPVSTRVVPGKTVKWEVIGDIRRRAYLDEDLAHFENFTTTDATGTVYASMIAGEITIPPYLRVLQDYVPGWVWVKASNLMSNWRGMEFGVDMMRNPTEESVQIEARYFAPAIGLRYSGGGERIASVNGGNGYQYLKFPEGQSLSSFPNVAHWRNGGVATTGTETFRLSDSSAEGSASAEISMTTPANGFGDQLSLDVHVAASGSGDVSLSPRAEILFDIFNPVPQRDLEFTWNVTTTGTDNFYSNNLFFYVGKPGGDTIGLGAPDSGTQRSDLGSHTYITLPFSLSAGARNDSSWSAEVDVKLVE